MARALPLLSGEFPPLPPGAPEPATVARLLLQWFPTAGRLFSWRSSADPYYVLIAEILLRKTGAAAVEAFLPSFIASYPSPEALAEAPVEVLSGTLAPLGLSRQRAEQLKALSAALVTQHGGVVPAGVEALAALPGVGAYTAGIVASTCSGLAVPAVDGNVARLVCRVFGIVPSHFEARKSTNVWQLAARLMRYADSVPVRLTWAELDLAAALCRARRPDHEHCPLRAVCVQVRSADQPPG